MGVNTRKQTTPRLEPPVTAVSKPSSFPMLLALRDLAWQLALAVILPVVIGDFVDDRSSTRPLYTLVGVAVAGAGAVIVVRAAIHKLHALEHAPGDKQ